MAQEVAKPRQGEGIHAFLIRNNRPPKLYQKEFIELNKKKLGKNNSLVLGVNYTLPPLKKSNKPTASNQNTSLPKTINEPLFGKKYSKVEVTSNALKDACFYVVCGHGGPDPGAIGKIGKHELHEDEYAYDIALRLARNLMAEGAKVHIIIQDEKDGIRDDRYLANSKRETCMGDAIPLNQTERLKQRSDKINALYKKDKNNYTYCRTIFIHIDSRSKRQQTDVFFYHCNKKAASKNLATTMKNTFEKKYKQHQPNRGFSGTVSGRNLYVLNSSNPASVYVELGNIQNSFDQQRIILSSNRQALANWLAEGFKEDYKR
ncbi:MAG: N-acetylmuramoyl-L-alanine amidase [Tannerellaceae bacterium]|nr:N-acetylmuramoyl-L-alanine amidase [Tannerellaceae bacterium]